MPTNTTEEVKDALIDFSEIWNEWDEQDAKELGTSDNTVRAVKLRRRGRALLKDRQPKAAINCFYKASRIDPSDFLSLEAIVVILTLEERWVEVLIVIEKLRAINSELLWVWKIQATASYYLGEYDEAIEAENYVLNIEPHCAEGWWVKGMSLRDLQNSKPFTEDEEAVYQQAIDCFDKAIAIKPSREIFWKEKMDTCACLIDDPQVKYKKNVELCTEYLSINPFLEVMWVLKCDSFLMANLDLGDMALGKEGLAVVEEGLKFLPKSSILWKYKSDALQRMGKFREASNALDTAIDLYDPKGLVDSPKSGLLVQKSNCLKRGGYYKEAKEAYDQAEEIVFRAAIPSDAPEYFIELFIKSLHDYQKSGKRENYENKKKAKPLPDNDLRQAIKNRSAQLGDGKPWPHPGKLIKEVFEKKDLTVYGAAQIMKVDRHFLRSIVRCERSINNEIAEKFAAHFSEWTEDDLLWVQLKHGQFQYKQLAPALEPTPAG